MARNLIHEDDDVFAQEITYNDLLNDKDLMAELKSLGWTQTPALKDAGSVILKPQSNRADKHQDVKAPLDNFSSLNFEIPDITGIGHIDDHNITLTSEDEMDEELLGALQGIQNELEEAPARSQDDPLVSVDDDSHVAISKPLEHNSEPEFESKKIKQEQISAITTISNISIENSKASLILPHQPTAATSTVATFTAEPIVSSNLTQATTSADDENLTQNTNIKHQGITEARQMALKFKREGNEQEAIKWMRKAKELEKNVLSNEPTSTVSSTSTQSTTKQKATTASSASSIASINIKESTLSNANVAQTSTDKFAPLEKALVEAVNTNLEEAKRLKAADRPKEAVLKLRESKRYGLELDVLRSRRGVPGANPAMFRWQIVKREIKTEYLDLGEDQVKLCIQRLANLSNLLKNYSARSVVLSYDLGFPKDHSITGKVNGIISKTGDLELNFNSVVSNAVKRSKSNLSASSIAKKKAEFTLILKRGMFFSDVILGTVTVPLTELASKCKIGGVYPFLVADEKGHKRSAAGSLEVYISLRKPLSTPEVIIHEDRTLVLEPWPEIAPEEPLVQPNCDIKYASYTRLPSANDLSMSTNSMSSQPTIKKSIIAASNVAICGSSSASATRPKPKSDLFSDVREEEKKDPLSVNFIVSNDVLEQEAKSIEKLLTKIPLNDDSRFNLDLRLQLVNAKLELLVRSVQQGNISMEDYVGLLKDRVARDSRLLLYLEALDERDSEAEEGVRKRVEIMQVEIQGVESPLG